MVDNPTSFSQQGMSSFHCNLVFMWALKLLYFTGTIFFAEGMKHVGPSVRNADSELTITVLVDGCAAVAS